MQNNKIALVAGATGLIGKLLLKKLASDSYYQEIITVTRRELTGDQPEKVRNIVVDFDNPGSFSLPKVDDVFCCLGTTMRKAGSREAFYKVDFTYPVTLAELTKNLGASKYLIVTALGADKDSKIYYNRVKGEVEDALAKIGFTSLFILRPSLLLGARVEKRPGERLAQILSEKLAFLFFGPFKAYKAIEAEKVAGAMVSLAKTDQQGINVISSSEIAKISMS